MVIYLMHKWVEKKEEESERKEEMEKV